MKIKFFDGTTQEFVSLVGADLRGANLRGVDLQRADLQRADLHGANLRGANLQYANLRGANLQRANLRWANLWGADLRGVNLNNAQFTPSSILLAFWGELSDSLTADCMELDASAHPDRSAFDRWADGGECPYADKSIYRIVNFEEERSLWGEGKLDTIWNIMMRIFSEKDVKFNATKDETRIPL